MKLNLLKTAIVCLFTVVAISSCKKDDDGETIPSGSIRNTITVTIGNGYDDIIDSVKAETWDVGNHIVLAKTEYKNGGFTITLPDSVSSQYLPSLFGDEIPEGITASNGNVKSAGVRLYAYKSDIRENYFRLRSGDWNGGLVYIDGDSYITGTSTDYMEEEDYTIISIYSLNLKKGWNIVYERETRTENSVTYERTTAAPAGAKWYFSGEDISSISGVRAKTPLLLLKK